MAFALKAAASIPASPAASAAGSVPSASFAAAVPRHRAAATGKVSFWGAAAVAEDKRSISGAFVELREQGKVAFVPFITAGDPDLATTAKALKILDACGSDVIELGVPYSNPLADGPVIQVLLTTPTTPKERMEKIAKASEGFIYLVSTVGVTGTRTNVSTKVQSLLQDIKQVTEKPVAVGFGVSTPEHVKQIAGWGADGVIVGSAMVRLLGESASPEEGLKKLEELAKNLKSALP